MPALELGLVSVAALYVRGGESFGVRLVGFLTAGLWPGSLSYAAVAVLGPWGVRLMPCCWWCCVSTSMCMGAADGAGGAADGARGAADGAGGAADGTGESNSLMLYSTCSASKLCTALGCRVKVLVLLENGRCRHTG